MLEYHHLRTPDQITEWTPAPRYEWVSTDGVVHPATASEILRCMELHGIYYAAIQNCMDDIRHGHVIRANDGTEFRQSEREGI